MKYLVNHYKKRLEQFKGVVKPGYKVITVSDDTHAKLTKLFEEWSDYGTFDINLVAYTRVY